MKKVLGIVVGILFAHSMWAEDVYAIFNAEAIKDANLNLATSGIVSDIFVDVGSEVQTGDLLLNLFNQDIIAQVHSVEQQYIFAKKQWERYKRSGGAVDKNTLDRYLSEYKKLEADYSYQKAVLSKTQLKAPFDGVIASKEVELGDGVSAQSTNLFRIISKDVKLVLEFDFKYISKVKVGDRFDFRIDGRKEDLHTTISKIYPTASTSTRKVKAEAVVKDIIPGTFGDGYIRTK
ncbi:efflux RND transporter periplasmic adaptor subunit [Helicobacter sp. MIT 21-1697]|uniref:efflux RND transporter periplasmic adaptor subunit n=1 Tax=Helicobacter sp. MIT 21-1697 TaxID=2993733 RepID=UPI00224B01FD|nr:HlyD family efflux transporter periplasmic adaptor subunit [Helicobacter sp. MIT 21-1697]MCX2717317.1 efflux RND transporter periplasmic adaptor subunit [Helicobacter sp. MIT 21-1697]